MNKLIGIFSRYATIIILGLSNLYLIYKILTPITIHATNLLLKIFTSTTLSENLIYTSQATIQIAPSCVAGAAFYLLLILLLATPNIKPKTRTKAIITAVATLFILNISRIVFLASIISYQNFETVHWIFWHLISTIFVVGTYIATIKIYKIKSIPFISDLKNIKSLAK